MELDVSVPRRDLLGVSGLSKELSPTLPPNIMLGKAADEAYLVASALRAPEAGTWIEYNLSEALKIIQQQARQTKAIYIIVLSLSTIIRVERYHTFLLGLEFSLSTIS